MGNEPCNCHEDLIDLLASCLAQVIGKYVPVSEHDNWDDVFDKYADYKEGLIND